MDEARFQAAIRMRNEGKPSGAYEELRIMLETAEDPVTEASLLLNMANCKSWEGDLDEAGALIEKARSLFPEGQRNLNLYADFLAASLLALRRRHAEAAYSFETLLVTYSDLLSTDDERDLYIDTNERLGLALVAAERFKDAIPILEDLLRRSVGEIQRIQLYLGIANSFLPGQNGPARSYFLTASEGDDKNLRTEADCRLGILEFQTRNFDVARRRLSAAYREAANESAWKEIALQYLNQLPTDGHPN